MCNLNEADGRAVDLFFAMRSDSERDLHEDGSMMQAVSAAELECVAKVLSPLDALAVAEPPADLAQRTVRAARRRALRARMSAPGEGEMGQIWNLQI